MINNKIDYNTLVNSSKRSYIMQGSNYWVMKDMCNEVNDPEAYTIFRRLFRALKSGIKQYNQNRKNRQFSSIDLTGIPTPD